MKEYTITVNGKTYDVQVEEGASGVAPVAAAPAAAPKAAPAAPKAAAPAPKPASGAGGKTVVKAPMPGTILDIKISVGASVKSGTVGLILEAMKMENEIMVPSDGTVASVNVTKGSSVNSGDVLFTLN
ncbi:acetyl-CoA carboxylase biotin carboxyl carrier protein subunit [Clostridia bacterium]|nr:acetyl-CoA carboxylase biotin carboxyl carrier protein subunit [Clostridia bacterium]